MLLKSENTKDEPVKKTKNDTLKDLSSKALLNIPKSNNFQIDLMPHNWIELGGSQALIIALKSKGKDNISMIRHLIQGEKVRSNFINTLNGGQNDKDQESLWTGLDELKENFKQDLSELPINELARIYVPKEFYNDFQEVLIDAWRLKIKHEFPQTFSLKGRRFSMDSFKALIGAFSLNTSLRALNFEHCGLTEKHAKYIATVIRIQPTITTIHLDHNAIGNKGMSQIAKALKDNDILASLSLKNNSIGNKGIADLAKGLRINRTLRSIDLSENIIGEEGRKSLEKAEDDINCIVIIDHPIL